MRVRSRRPRSARARGRARDSGCARLRAARESPAEAFVPSAGVQVLEGRPGFVVKTAVGFLRLPFDRALAPLQPQPPAVAVDQNAAVAKDVGEQQGRTLRLSESNELNAPTGRALELLAQFRTRARAVTAQLDEKIDI